MCKKLLFLAALVLLMGASASASVTDYTVTVDTSSLAGTTGAIEFDFGPGPLVTQAADLQIIGFSSDGNLLPGQPDDSPLGAGDVSGALPDTLYFDNGVNGDGTTLSSYNDYYEDITFGNTISFEVYLYGPALSSPNGTASSGSTFAFTIWDDEGNPALTTNADGYALTTAVNLDGTTTTTDFSPETMVTPEPTSMILFGTGLLAIGFVKRKLLFA